jgi:hypothetical protein
MLVKNWMSKPAITAHVDTRPAEALDLMQRHDIHMLPVMEAGGWWESSRIGTSSRCLPPRFYRRHLRVGWIQHRPKPFMKS